MSDASITSTLRCATGSFSSTENQLSVMHRNTLLVETFGSTRENDDYCIKKKRDGTGVAFIRRLNATESINNLIHTTCKREETILHAKSYMTTFVSRRN